MRRVDGETGGYDGYLTRSASVGMQPKEHLQGYGYTELCLMICENASYRKAANILNRVLHFEDDTRRVKASTLSDRVESFGSSLSDAYAQKAESVLEDAKIDASTGIITESSDIPQSVRTPQVQDVYDEAKMQELADSFNHGRDEAFHVSRDWLAKPFETDASRCCYISIDDIGVKSQKEKRYTSSGRKKKYVENTVIHVQSGEKQYTLTAHGMRKAFKLLVAFLLNNKLMEDMRLIFFTDGANCIRENISRYFAFREHTIILDWLHLKKKCKELVCSSIAGTKEDRNEVHKTLMAMLWAGNADNAMEYIAKLPEKSVRNKGMLAELKGYIERKSPYMACYAMRHELGLRISSNRVEKENDLIVASRQKHNGMAWSVKGSEALAVIVAASRNGELNQWTRTKSISFTMAAA